MKGKPKGPKVPYRLPQLIAAPLTATIYFVEGEKDADSLAKLDFVATTASEGAGAKWDFELTKWFKDRHVVILPDADKPGRNHAQKVAKAIDRLAASVRVVDLYPDCRDDVSDWLRDDPSGARLAKLVQDAPLWEPGADSGQDDGKASSHSDTSPSDVSGTLLRKKQADVLIGLADAAYLFHTPTHDAYADVTKADHRETYRVRSKPFRSWLAHRFYVAIKGAPNSEAMQSALGVIEARAVFDGPEIAVQVRVAGQAGKLYLDLADEKWRAVEIDADGWRVISSPPVRFRRAAGMLALPEPVSGGSINALRPLINVRKGKDGDVDFVLVVAWLLAVLRDVGPYPVLGLSGEHGVAKSMMSRLLRALIDPNTAPLRLPREDRDLFITANNGLVLGFDNVSGIPPWISDTLCRLATGGGFSVRQLYTDDSEMGCSTLCARRSSTASRTSPRGPIWPIARSCSRSNLSPRPTGGPSESYGQRSIKSVHASSARCSTRWLTGSNGFRTSGSNACRAWLTSPCGSRPASRRCGKRVRSRTRTRATETRPRLPRSTPIWWPRRCRP